MFGRTRSSKFISNDSFKIMELTLENLNEMDREMKRSARHLRAARKMYNDMKENQLSKNKNVFKANVEEGMCKGCGNVPINNAADEYCPECYQDKLANEADKWGEQLDVGDASAEEEHAKNVAKRLEEVRLDVEIPDILKADLTGLN